MLTVTTNPLAVDFRFVGTQCARVHEIAPGLSAYVIEFSNQEPYARYGNVEDRLELVTLLAGELVMDSPIRGTRFVSAGQVYAYNPGEIYVDQRTAIDGAGVLVGFRVSDASKFGWEGEPRARDIVLDEPRLREVAAAFYEDEKAGRPFSCGAIVEAVVEAVNRQCSIVAPDRLERARLYIEEHFAAPLYVAHLAEVAGMLPETFTRAFRRRFRTTPIEYRLRVRLRAGRELLLSRPDATVTAVAVQIGFESTRFFRAALRSRRHFSPHELRAVYREAHGIPERIGRSVVEASLRSHG